MIGFGVGLPGETQQEGILHHGKMLDMLKASWWYDWMDLVPEDRRYVPMVRRLWRDNFSDAFVLGQRDRTRYWFMGNEPDRKDQDDTTPEQFAKNMKAWQANVGSHIAVPGVLIDDGGIAWLDEFLRFSRLPVNMRWHIHIYANDGLEWTQKWKRFQRWMVDNRFHSPVVVSETASMSTTVGNQLEVMTTAYNTLRSNKWLVGVGWFSAHYSTFRREYERTDLFNKRGVITVLGEWFQVFAKNAPTTLLPIARTEVGEEEPETHSGEAVSQDESPLQSTPN